MEHLSFTSQVMTSQWVFFFHSPIKINLKKNYKKNVVLEFLELPTCKTNSCTVPQELFNPSNLARIKNKNCFDFHMVTQKVVRYIQNLVSGGRGSSATWTISGSKNILFITLIKLAKKIENASTTLLHHILSMRPNVVFWISQSI